MQTIYNSYYGIQNLWWDAEYRIYSATCWIKSLFVSDAPPPTMEETVANLLNIRALVDKRESELREQMESHRERAVQFVNENKVREARVQIRLRLLYDNQVVATQRVLTAIESHLVQIQSASLNKQVFLALHDSSRALGTVDDEEVVDDVLDRLDEQHSQTKAIMDIISAQDTDVFQLDDDQIDRELRCLLPDNNNSLVLPVVPTTAIHINRQIIEEELVSTSTQPPRRSG